MLAPRYLAGLGDELADIYAQLECDILADMARRIARLGKITEATRWQAAMLAETGALKRRVNTLLKKYDPQIRTEIKAVYNDALIKSARADNRIFYEATGRKVSEHNAQAMLAGIAKTHSDLSRLTMTTAHTTEQEFIQQANAAYMKVASGAFTYDSAMKDATDALAADGLTAVQYNNGKPVRRSIEAAARMNILTGVNQTAAAVSVSNCEELGCDLVETSAHIGARPEHEAWQGKVFSLSGTSTKYPPFSVCGFGEITGICGVNCRHSFYPYFEGETKHYTMDDLDEMAAQKVEYNGEQMTRYEGEEKLRGIERTIRKYKRRAVVQDAAGIDNTAARAKIGEWQQKAADFTKQTGIARDRAREFIGTVDGTQPRALNPSVIDEQKNLKLAQDIKRLDNSRSKKVCGVVAGEPMTFEKADGAAPNPNYRKGGGFTTNCQSCVVTYEMRRRGYNVQTLPKTPGSMLDVLSHNTSLAWVDKTTGKNPAYIIPGQRTLANSLDWIKNNIAANHRYTIEFDWKDGSSGHIVHIFKAGGELHIYDPQTAKHYIGESLIEFLRGAKPSTIQLMDVEACDVNLNVINKIMEVTK